MSDMNEFDPMNPEAPTGEGLAVMERAGMERSGMALSGVRKAAILCVAMGDDLVSEIFRHLDEDEVQAITKELAALQRVTSEVADDVVEEFHQLMLAQSYIASGGVDYAKRLLVKTYGPEIAKRL